LAVEGFLRRWSDEQEKDKIIKLAKRIIPGCLDAELERVLGKLRSK
jgi:hypothetical protein